MKIQDNFPYAEFAALHDGRMTRNVFLRCDDTDAINDWLIKNNHTDCFCSVCRFVGPSRNSAFISSMAFDLDSPVDLERARSDAVGLCQMLMENAKMKEDCLDLSFSGFKGFHIMVSGTAFNPQPSQSMLPLYRRIAEKAKNAGCTSIDLGIYDKARIWRMGNTLNSKGQFFKIPLTYKELQELSIEQIKIIAKSPRGEDSFATPAFCQATADWYQKAISVLEKESKIRPPNRQMNLNFKHGWRMLPCIKVIEGATIPDGIRHRLYTSLSRYYAYLNMHPDEIFERLQKIDSRNPIRDQECIARISTWGYTHPGFSGCADDMLGNYCQKNVCFYARQKNENNK